jgi:ABC-type antimicrobial peptide transport system permease subunit
VERASTVVQSFAETIRARRFQAWLFGTFAAASLMVSAIGILGLVAMSTTARTTEIGIRMALGARASQVVGGLIRERLVAVLVVLAACSAGCLAAVGLLRSNGYGLTGYDGRVWLTGLGCVFVAAALGVVAPALYASGVNIVRAVRTEP